MAVSAADCCGTKHQRGRVRGTWFMRRSCSLDDKWYFVLNFFVENFTLYILLHITILEGNWARIQETIHLVMSELSKYNGFMYQLIIDNIREEVIKINYIERENVAGYVITKALSPPKLMYHKKILEHGVMRVWDWSNFLKRSIMVCRKLTEKWLSIIHQSMSRISVKFWML